MNIKQFLGGTMLLLMSTVIFAEVRHIDAIVATVDEGVITERDIKDMKNTILLSLPEGYKPADDELQGLALSRLIEDKLLLQYGKNNMVSVTDDEIIFFIAQTAQIQNMTVDEFYKKIEKEGISKKMLDKTVAESLLIDKVKSNFFSNSEKSSEDQMQQSYHRWLEHLQSGAYIKVN